MAAANYSSDVLQMFYGPIPRDQNRNLRRPLQPELVVLYDGFLLSQTNYREWLRVWNMVVSEGNPNNKALFVLARENKAKFTDLVENEIRRFKSVKVSFGLEVKFSIALRTDDVTNLGTLP